MNPVNLLTMPLSGQCLIEASAGTGKTYTISHLALRLIVVPEKALRETPLKITELLVVTFTKAATQELRDRIRHICHDAKSYLEKGQKSTQDVEAIIALALKSNAKETLIHRLDDAILALDDAPIFTIHGFCQRTLKEFGFSMGEPIEQTLMEDPSESLQQAAQSVWRETLYSADGARAAFLSGLYGHPDTILSSLKTTLTTQFIDPLEGKSLSEVLGTFDALYDRTKQLWHQDQSVIQAFFAKGIGRSYTKRWVPSWLNALGDYFEAADKRYLPFKHQEKFTQSLLDEKLGEKSPQHPLFTLLDELWEQQANLREVGLSHFRHELLQKIERKKQEEGLLFFDDLIKRLADAISSESLLSALRGRYPVALIDEFQDTDQHQYRIFNAIYQSYHQCLLMIGDPKQAIYRFRGADIDAYFEARKPISDDQQYTLATNHRTVPSLVNQVNALFSLHPLPFVLEQFPPFIQVAPSSHQQDKDALFLGKTQTTMAVSELIHQDKPLTKEAAVQQAATQTALWIKKLLSGDANVKGRAVKTGDIAVLVRTGGQAEIIKEALKIQGINSVFLSKQSVLATEEAYAFAKLIELILSPFDRTLLFTVLGDKLLQYDAAQLKVLVDAPATYAETQQRFVDANMLWKKGQFFSAVNRLLDAFNVQETLLKTDNGERKLTNLLQLIELFYEPDNRHLPMEEQWLRYLHLLAKAEDSQTQKLRLETEASLVEIVTIHKSKGLEYPIVCCPFLLMAKEEKDSIVALHQKATGQKVIHYRLTGDQQRQRRQEALAEDCRLLYVALTRAKCHVHLCLGEVKGMELSGLHHVLFGMEKPDDVFESFKKWDVPIEHLVDQPSFLDDEQATEPAPLSIAPLTYKLFRPFIARSYSALAKASHARDESLEDAKDRDEAVSESIDPPPFEANLFHFPKGSEAGNFLHQVLEDCSFDELETLDDVLASQLPLYQYDTECWHNVLKDSLQHFLQKPLPSINISLHEIGEKQVLKEMGFYLMAKPNAYSIQQLLSAYRGTPVLQDYNLMQDDFKGFIDLIFEHEGKFYVADYKSNFLGFDDQDYAPGLLVAAMQSHDYDLQYLIYVAAVSRYLKTRIADFDYERHIGGVFYFFLRGINEKNDNGIYFAKPSRQQIEQVDALFFEGVA